MGESYDLSTLQRVGPQGPGPRPALPPRRWKTRIALPASLVAAVAALAMFTAWDSLSPRAEVHVVPVLFNADPNAAPAQGEVVVQAPGWVEPAPFASAVSALADGVVREVLVLEGERVEPGQIVVQLVDDDARIAVQSAQAAVAERLAALEQAQAQLEEAERNWENPVELVRRVERARADAAAKQAELERWPAELEREQARAVYLEAEHRRVAALRQNGQANEIEIISAQQAHAEQQAEVEATRRREPILQAERRALQAEVRAAEEDLRLRIADQRALEAGRAAVAGAHAALASARADLQEAELRLQRMQVRSPVAGVVMTRLVAPGSKVMLGADDPQSAQVLRLYDPARLQVRVDIPLADAAKVGLGQPAEVFVDVLPERAFRGRVSRVVHEADVQKNTLQVKVALDDPAPEIKPEMLARVRFMGRAAGPAPGAKKTQAASDAVGAEASNVGAEASTAAALRCLVPRAAVMDAGSGPWVWLADQTEHRARRQPVELGGSLAAEGRDWTVVRSGVQPGDRVIVDAPPGLTHGMRIRLIED